MNFLQLFSNKQLNRDQYYRNRLSAQVRRDKQIRSLNRCLETEHIKRKLPKYLRGEMQMLSAAGSAFSLASACYLGRKTDKTMSKAHHVLEDLQTNINLIAQSILSTIDTLKENLTEKTKTAIDCFTFVKEIIVGLLNVMMSQSKYMIYSVILNFTSVIAKYIHINPLTLCKQFYDQFLILINYKKEEGPEVQFLPESVEKILADDKSNFCKLLFFCIVNLFYVVLLGRCPGKVDCESMINRMGNLARSTFSMKQMYQAIEPVALEAQEFVKQTLGIKTPSELERILDGYKIWELEIEKLVERHEQMIASDRILRDKDFVLKIENLYRQGLEYSRELSSMRISRDLQFSFHEHQKLLTNLYKQIDTTGVFGDKPRIRPIVIWLYGESQIGKSGMTWPLAIDLNSELVVDPVEAKDFSKHVYFRNVEQEFWDNYKQQNIVVYDDFGQTKDLEGAPNAEFLEIIRSANIAPYPLHMAHLEDKRKTKFTSKVLMLTSNKKELKVNSLTFPDAVLARINLCGRVHLKKEYQSKGYSLTTQREVYRLDKDKARSESGTPINTNVYLIDVIDAESNAVLASDLTYDQFKEKAIQILHKELLNSMELTQYLSSYAAESFGKRKGDISKIQTTSAEVQMIVNEDAMDVVNMQYDVVEDLESKEFEEKVERLYETCLRNSYYEAQLCGIDLAGNIKKIVLECNPIISTLDFFANAIRFEFYSLQKQNPGITRIGFYKKDLERRWGRFKQRTSDLIEEMKKIIKKTWSESPFSLICTVLGLCIPLMVLIVKVWPSSFRFDRVKKHIFVTNRTVSLPHLTNVTDFNELVYQIKVSNAAMVSVSIKKPLSDMALEQLDTMLDSIDTFVFVVLDKEQHPASTAENTKIIVELKRVAGSTIANGKPCPIAFTCDMEGNMSVQNPFMKPMDLELAQSGDVITRKLAHKTYLELFKDNVTNLTTNDILVQTIVESTIKPINENVEIASSGDSVTRKQQRTQILELANSGDAVTRKQQLKQILELNEFNSIKDKNEVKQVEVHPSGDSVTLKTKVKQYLEAQGEIQLQEDINAHQLISHKILKNMYACEMYSYDSNTNQNILCGKINILFVRGHLAITPKHIRYALDKCNKIVLTNAYGNRYEMLRENVQFKNMFNCLGEELECCMLNFPSYVPQHSDIVSHFTNAESMSLYTNMRTLLPSLRQQKDKYLPYIYVGFETEAQDVPLNIEDSSDASLTCVIRRGVQYTAATERGDCGSPLIVDNSLITKKILGVHVVGKLGNRCIAETINQKDLLRAFKQFDSRAQIQFYDESLHGYKLPEVTLLLEQIILQDDILKFVPCENFMPIGTCTTSPFTANQTEIRPSLVYGKIAPLTTKPAHLKPVYINGEKFDIKQQMLKKAAMNTPYIPKFLIDAAYISVKAKILKNINNKYRRILTLEESVEGIQGEEYLGPINRVTSPGYPWVLDRISGKGKQQWLGDDQEYKITDDLRTAIEYRLTQAKKGIRVPCIWTDTLKDERRPLAKVDAGKTRVFAAGPQDFTLLYRQYFLGFMAHLMNNRIYNEQSLGTNVFSEEWGMTARYLQEVGDKVIAGDFQTFDGTLNSSILERFVDLVNEYYDDGEENALVRQVLFCEIINSIHLFPEWNMFYMWTHSQTSGSPTTTAVNSFYNSMGVRLCFLILVIQNKFKYTIKDFDRYVRMVSYGDDDVINISNDIIEWFNQETITKAFAVIGMIYTDEAKTGEEAPKYRRINEIAYLKRKFIYDKTTQTWLAPLDLSVCLETPNWIRNKIDPLEATKQNCEVAIGELAWHDKEVFEKYSNMIEKAFRQTTGKSLDIQTYDGYHMERMFKYFLADDSTFPSVTHAFYNCGEKNVKALEMNRGSYSAQGSSGGSPTENHSTPCLVTLGCVDSCDFLLQ